MKTIIAGTRTIKDYRIVREAIKQSGRGEEITEIVSGASKDDVEAARFDERKLNVDVLGAQLAMLEGVPVKYFPADWDTYGKAAGPIRNKAMAEYADALILVWDGKSRGSANMLMHAKNHGLTIYEHIVAQETS